MKSHVCSGNCALYYFFGKRNFYAFPSKHKGLANSSKIHWKLQEILQSKDIFFFHITEKSLPNQRRVPATFCLNFLLFFSFFLRVYRKRIKTGRCSAQSSTTTTNNVFSEWFYCLYSVTSGIFFFGRRFQFKVLKNNLIETVILTGPAAGQMEHIACIPMIPTNLAFPFKGLQFPVRLSFATTINKSQGQTYKYVGIDLRQ